VTWIHGIAERYHDISNPTTEAKIGLLGSRLRLGPESRVLDIASGRGGPALVLAGTFGCHVTCVERFPGFVAAARERAAAAGLDALIHVVQADATDVVIEPSRYDVVMCLGATFVYGGFEPTLDRLVVGARPGGHVVVGEPYWRVTQLPDGFDPRGFRSFADLFTSFERRGLPVVTVVGASEGDWDNYVTLRFLAVQDWLDTHSSDADADAIRAQHEASKAEYARERGLIGWAMIAGRRSP